MAIIDLSKPDPNRNRRNGLIAALVVVFYLVILVQCQGQTRKYPFYKPDTVTRITTVQTALFFVNTEGREDTIFLGVCVDSINPKIYRRSIYVFYPKGTVINDARLDIGFNKGGIESFKYERIFPPFTYVDYLLTEEQYEKLKNQKYEYINFHINDFDVPFVLDKGGEYFVKFFKEI